MFYSDKESEYSSGDVLIYGFESEGCHIIPPFRQPSHFSGDSILWILPAGKEGRSTKISCGKYRVTRRFGKVRISVSDYQGKEEYDARPCCDFFGHKIVLDIEDGSIFELA